MPVGMLIDTTKCIGCRGCQAACKRWNMLPTRESKIAHSGDMTNPKTLNANNYNVLHFYELEEDDKLSWHFVHKRCFHCYAPACASVCPVAALHKLANGCVVWDEAQCFACRYCQNACPFQIPKFQFDSNWGKIEKCHLCWNRIEDGLKPTCATTCPTGAIRFGERADMVEEAYDRIKKYPDRYEHYLYGEHEVGGTAVVYLMPVEYEKLGFKYMEKEIYTQWTHEFLSRIPLEVGILLCVLLAIWAFRKNRLEKKASETVQDNNAEAKKIDSGNKKSKREKGKK